MLHFSFFPRARVRTARKVASCSCKRRAHAAAARGCRSPVHSNSDTSCPVAFVKTPIINCVSSVPFVKASTRSGDMVAPRRQRHLVLTSRSADMRMAALGIALFCFGSVCASSLSYVSTRDPFAMEVRRAARRNCLCHASTRILSSPLRPTTTA